MKFEDCLPVPLLWELEQTLE